MDKKTKGSWLIHHTNKLQGVTNQSGYEKTYLAGKAGILLSAISANNDTTVNNDRLAVLATAANINTTFELPKLIEVLQQQKLIDKSSGGVAVLGVTTATALQHTSDLFDSLTPSVNELASITLAERASVAPILANDIASDLADTYKLATADLGNYSQTQSRLALSIPRNLAVTRRCCSTATCFAAIPRKRSRPSWIR